MPSIEKTGFKTKQAAEVAIMGASIDPPYSSLHPAFVRRDESGAVLSADIFVRDPLNRAGGRIHTWRYRAKCRDGQYREFFGATIGA